MRQGATIISTVLFTAIIVSTCLQSRDTLAKDHTNVCPDDMVQVQGDFCPLVIQTCLKVDKSVHNVNGFVRCLKFAPTKCLTPSNKNIHMDFCIDRYEFPNKKDVKPDVMISWYDVKKSCENEGKRLCVDHEWSLACEGPEILPYPYGYIRDDRACNIDHNQRPWFHAESSNMTPDIVARLDQRVPSGSMSGCVSPYGVYDMTGNVDEFVLNSSGHPYVSALMGGHWVKGARNRCRPETLIHGPTTVYYPIGGRCCKDLP
jgi:formylglycine-generating enzyme